MINVTQRNHIVSAIESAEFCIDPFPQMYIRNMFPLDIFEQMEQSLPAKHEWEAAIPTVSRVVNGKTELVQDPGFQGFLSFHTEAFKPGIHPFDDKAAYWRDTFSSAIDEVQANVMRKFASRGGHNGVNQNLDWASGDRLFFYRFPGWHITPHVHPENELVAMMFYFPTHENTSEDGTYSYRLRDGVVPKNKDWFQANEVEVVKIAPFLSNSLFCWRNGPNAVHGSLDFRHGTARRYLYVVANACSPVKEL